MTHSNEIGVSEGQSSRSFGSGDIGGKSGPDHYAAAHPSSNPVNMNSAPTLGYEQMSMNMSSHPSGASAQYLGKNIDI